MNGNEILWLSVMAVLFCGAVVRFGPVLWRRLSLEKVTCSIPSPYRKKNWKKTWIAPLSGLSAAAFLLSQTSEFQQFMGTTLAVVSIVALAGLFVESRALLTETQIYPQFSATAKSWNWFDLVDYVKRDSDARFSGWTLFFIEHVMGEKPQSQRVDLTAAGRNLYLLNEALSKIVDKRFPPSGNFGEEKQLNSGEFSV